MTKPIASPKTNYKVKSQAINATAKHLVAIDLGSNSFHLIIAREQDGCLQILHRQKQSIGLAAGLDGNNFLNEAVIDKAISCLQEFNLSLMDLPCCVTRIVGTQALRKAKNIESFKQKAMHVLPYPIDVISGKHEAELIYKGVAHTQPLRGLTFIVDIGVGSTELVIGQHFSTSLTDSLDMGCISFQQQFFLNGDINADKMLEAQLFATTQLSGIADRYRELNDKVTLGTSGSIKVISQIMLELYGDNKITAKRLKRLVKQLIRWQHCDNIPLRSLEDARRPLLAGAVAILSSCFSQLGIEQMKFSLGGLREGVLYDLSQSRTDIDTRERTVNNLMKLYNVDQAFNQRVLQQITVINKQLKKDNMHLSEIEYLLVCWAAQLHEIGIVVNSKKIQQHGAYIITHSNMPGFSEDEIAIITLLIRNHRGKIKLKLDDQSLLTIDKLRVDLLVQILRVAIILTQVRGPESIMPVTAHYHNQQFIISHVGQNALQKKLDKEVIKQANANLVLAIQS